MASSLLDVCVTLAELLSEQARIERAKTARAAVVERNPVKKPDLENDAITKYPKSEPKERSRQQAAKSTGVSERKVQQAQTIPLLPASG